MAEKSIFKTECIHIKNMVSNCCVVLLKEKLEDLGITVIDISLGKANISYNTNEFNHQKIDEFLKKYGFSLLKNKDDKLVSDIKIAVVELIHQLNNVNSIVRKSDYLVEKLGYSYPHLSKVFSDHEHITLEKYIINHKIERIKHLLDDDEYSLSEIAYMMDYSSVQYLSNQFKKITGITVSQYKKGSEISARSIDDL
jgi:AraC-like DNA-binding protein